jgi:hypothetical protein
VVKVRYSKALVKRDIRFTRRAALTIFKLIHNHNTNSNNIFVIQMGGTEDSFLSMKNAIHAHVPKQAKGAFNTPIIFMPGYTSAVPTGYAGKMFLKDSCSQVSKTV